ncbi:hypothetical protein MKW98_023904 [Papaver atlanticum]|uniref:Transmembrane protein n=1 Tax=Papaver atlanticum TaxID=357466 RepID=A0AAD4SXF3_9MAGN|nr:hypothetical protein MKW98_023904 [Papaver atlanticum]
MKHGTHMFHFAGHGDVHHDFELWFSSQINQDSKNQISSQINRYCKTQIMGMILPVLVLCFVFLMDKSRGVVVLGICATTSNNNFQSLCRGMVNMKRRMLKGKKIKRRSKTASWWKVLKRGSLL